MTQRFSSRFNGREAFVQLPQDVQIEIGGLALELILAWNGQDAYDDPRVKT
ncbi:hypothetical protein [Beijerinckia indica]|nr:hypothetical protein [Beijerinckia indica]